MSLLFIFRESKVFLSLSCFLFEFFFELFFFYFSIYAYFSFLVFFLFNPLIFFFFCIDVHIVSHFPPPSLSLFSCF